MTMFESLLLGVVEGLTEFLPISSTGHLILVSQIFGIEQSESHKSFEIAIQLGSILAVVAIYFRRFLGDFNLLGKLAVAFAPTGAVGFLLYKHIKTLFESGVAAYSLIIGGLVLIAIELFKKSEANTIAVENITYKKAFAIGCAQCFSMIPGTSRSAATIIGGLLCGLDRKTAAEFSFLLAVPTMLIATSYDLLKNYDKFSANETANLLVGFITAFVVALVVIKTFLRFISKINFIPFGIYRIAIGLLFIFIILR